MDFRTKAPALAVAQPFTTLTTGWATGYQQTTCVSLPDPGCETTNHTLDVAAGLPQVLADGDNTYLYGLGRISQQSAIGTDYFLADALGSVRQLTDANGALTPIKSYSAAVGEALSTDRCGTSSYRAAFLKCNGRGGFTGEWSDSYIKLIYLCSRHYSPETGRRCRAGAGQPYGDALQRRQRRQRLPVHRGGSLWSSSHL